MLYRCRGAQAHDLLNVRIVSRRKYVVTHTCYRTSTSRGIQSLNITRCTCSGLHSTSSRNTIQHAVKVALASVICLTIVSLGKPAAANNVVRKQQSSDTYAAASLNDRGRPPGLSIPEQVRAFDELTAKAQASADAGAYRDAVDQYSSIVSKFPGLALSERARIRRAVLLYETGEVQQAILELDDEEVALRGNAEVHAALAAILYAERPLERQRAELQWELASEFDTRYEDMGWVAREKHWGPNLLLALEKFLTLQ